MNDILKWFCCLLAVCESTKPRIQLFEVDRFDGGLVVEQLERPSRNDVHMWRSRTGPRAWRAPVLAGRVLSVGQAIQVAKPAVDHFPILLRLGSPPITSIPLSSTPSRPPLKYFGLVRRAQDAADARRRANAVELAQSVDCEIPSQTAATRYATSAGLQPSRGAGGMQTRRRTR